jgi:putative phosphoribosyl transferase
MDYLFANRVEAGIQLAQELRQHQLTKPLMLALPRGGVPIAHEIFRHLGIPWEVLITRKIGAPYNPEYGIGAISEDDKPLLTPAAYLREGVVEDAVAGVISLEQEELHRRIKLYRHDRSLPDLHGRDVVLIDDGVATGITAAAAARYVSSQGAARVILAVPVGPNVDNPILTEYVDEIICLHRPADFWGVGSWYADFEQVSDQEVIHYIEEKQQLHPES